MIVGAGLGVRLRPLTALRPKPVLPVGGIPLIAYTLAWLRGHGVTEVAINVHHLPEIVEARALQHCPPGMQIRFSREETLLDTGGGIARLASFLRESDPCLLVAGDMLVDADLRALVARHRERGDALTLLLREDARMRDFGSIGVDAAGRVRRIAGRLDLGDEVRAGLYYLWPTAPMLTLHYLLAYCVPFVVTTRVSYTGSRPPFGFVANPAGTANAWGEELPFPLPSFFFLLPGHSSLLTDAINLLQPLPQHLGR